MQFCLIFSTLTATLVPTLTETLEANYVRPKRTNVDNFNVLLKLYKMNPLKQSKTFKKFTDSVLLPTRVDEPSMVLNFDSNESTKVRQARTNEILKGIEKKIHETNPSQSNYQKPDYNIDEVDTEKFRVNILLNDSLIEEQAKLERTEDDNSFKFLFGHLESSEVDKLPVTKMLPISNNSKVKIVSELYKVPQESMTDNDINYYKEDLQNDPNKNMNTINDDLVDPEVIIL